MSELDIFFRNPDKREWLINLWGQGEYSGDQWPNRRVDKDWDFLIRFTKYNLFLFNEESEWK